MHTIHLLGVCAVMQRQYHTCVAYDTHIPT